MARVAGIVTFLLLLLPACAGSGPPQLAPVGDVIPAGVSLEGRWKLQDGAAAADKRIRSAQYRSNGGPRGADGPSVFVFLRTGERLKISQTPYALFVSFDRSVVEEYRFREHRLVSVGPIEADRASGWVDGRYVIQTLDTEGALLEETYALEAGGDVLVRTVTVTFRKETVLALQQAYDRLD
ncbi:MAG TPA: hypothetical protein VLW45_09040 [Pelomicrobium sp.]|nr:hypothetical protein [Pelomicrobium sp.]